MHINHNQIKDSMFWSICNFLQNKLIEDESIKFSAIPIKSTSLNMDIGFSAVIMDNYTSNHLYL